MIYVIWFTDINNILSFTLYQFDCFFHHHLLLLHLHTNCLLLTYNVNHYAIQLIYLKVYIFWKSFYFSIFIYRYHRWSFGLTAIILCSSTLVSCVVLFVPFKYSVINTCSCSLIGSFSFNKGAEDLITILLKIYEI